ncbi:MAG: bifunctional hydroxymethylpyrimidine kinase/phosphomethylpyrimidine kinase [Sphaerochaeta sp.]
MKNVLTIAGSDCSGGAGIQADLKTMLANKVYGMSVITSLTAQNTMKVISIDDVRPSFVEEQLEAIFSDIVPDAIKIGMVSNVKIIESIAKKLKKYHAKNIVLDPVAVSTSGFKLIDDDAIEALKTHLFPIATVITPNLFEAELLLNKKLEGESNLSSFAEELSERYDVSSLVKGGHLDGKIARDVLFNDGKSLTIEADMVENDNTHGTGCTLSSAIACNLAKGYSLEDSVRNAKEYLTCALKAQMNVGHGSGPVDHGYYISCEW